MDLTSDERDVFQYLKTWRRQFVSGKEICRRASGKKRYREDPRWAFRVLPLMMEKGIIESDSNAHYRIKEDDEKTTAKAKRKKWIAPHIQRILKQSGKKFEDIDLPE